MPKSYVNEKNVLIQFEGWEVDIFICESGDLGMTVTEHGKTHKDIDAKSQDIFVNKDDIRIIHSC